MTYYEDQKLHDEKCEHCEHHGASGDGGKMSNENQKTIEDIVADIRAQNQGLPEDGYALSPLVCDLLSFADRIEAAAKREREAGAAAAQICGEIGEMIGREAAGKDSLQVGNSAKLREACENIAEYAKTAACYIEDIDDAHLLGYLNQIERWAEAALSAPPRNCDLYKTLDDARNAFFVDYVPDETSSSAAAFATWLFDEAKGDTDGSK